MKSIAATAIVLIAILSAITLTGIYALANFSLTQFIIRSHKEMGIVTEINKLEFFKKALNQALVYSFYQGIYDVAKLGGYADFAALKLAKDSGLPVYNELPLWRVYSSTFSPDFIQNLTNRTSKIFLEYTSALNSTNVSIPLYSVSVKVPLLHCPKQSYSFSEYEGLCQGTYTCFTEEKSIDEDESPPTCTYYQRKVHCGPGGATDCETPCIFDITNSPLPNWCCWKNSATFTASCYPDPLKSPNLKVEATAKENLKTKIENLANFSDSANFTKNIKTNFPKLFGIGNETFVSKDSIKNAIEKGIGDANLKNSGEHSRCSVCPSKSEVFRKANTKSIAEAKDLIIQKILNKEKELEKSVTTNEFILRLVNDLKEVNISITNCQEEWFTKSINNQQTNWCKKTCDFSYYAAARVLVNITDNTKKYPVYDFKERTTKLRNLQLFFYLLSGNSELIYPYNATCVDNDGDKYFAYNPYSCPFGNDCDDYNSNKNPGAFDIECNGIDEDCDGSDYCSSVECACFETEAECEGNCEWCKECENIPGRYSGNVDRCVNANTCSYRCERGKCNAECDSGYTFEWGGTTCKHNCQLTSTCTFASSCTTKCPYPQSYCLNDNYCYYNVGCSGTGCSYTSGDYCPPYKVTDNTCNYNPRCSSTGSCSYSNSCSLGECCTCSSSGCVDDNTKCGTGKICVGCSCVPSPI